nr:MAG TPA: hypothetical protein [Caudoviricetes sp.]
MLSILYSMAPYFATTILHRKSRLLRQQEAARTTGNIPRYYLLKASR